MAQWPERWPGQTNQTSGQALMRSRSSEVGVGLVVAKGHMGLTIKDECKPIPVEVKKKKKKKTQEENINLHMLSWPDWEFLVLINPRHRPSLQPPPPPQPYKHTHTHTSHTFSPCNLQLLPSEKWMLTRFNVTVI